MSVLVDSSVWIEYFRGSGNHASPDFLIAENLVVVNNPIRQYPLRPAHHGSAVLPLNAGTTNPLWDAAALSTPVAFTAGPMRDTRIG